ncbi:Putative oxalyl-CoA decarboxylase [Cavenderia fasciculata]|uniref:2-hydroxyacyl-CoA lyase n=1 Tax=Cavenderia fasciculata TaxID=261658 RepID=F4PT73_CACFS|nr:Putative oxalyl-CoA decarboxylase [Cavenderia fasciculata]EGG20809.1 Putative oxalyl-CoA decarboxylase [Cavenderia fasciculata]|eukprot:XP_004358659.1 Putative oxalyl-CoA decarboxylase [Cavenderia fasciculata]
MENIKIISKIIKNSGIEQTFGVVGVPITNVVYQMQKDGLPFYGFRNEQAASYAASIVGYLTRKPALCFTVSGPGLIHALPGAINAQANSFPLVVMSSSPNPADLNKGSFQECPQFAAAVPCFKTCYYPPTIEQFATYFIRAVRESVSGRPGPVYIQVPSVLMQGTAQINDANKSLIENIDTYGIIEYDEIPRPVPQRGQIEEALQMLISRAKRPLIIGGKGAAYSGAEKELRRLVDATKIPFLPSPMGKGIVSDEDEYSVASARSVALKRADYILVLGARLNWMFGYGVNGFASDVKFIVVDIFAEHQSHIPANSLFLLGDIRATLEEMNSVCETAFKAAVHNGSGQDRQSWMKELTDKAGANASSLKKQMEEPQQDGQQLTYHQVYNVLARHIPKNAPFVNEGANTMDIGRVCIQHTDPRCRLDCGSLSTMGVGVGYAIAASAVYNNKRTVYAVQGDSAFGFSGMEIEVAVRYRQPILFIIINNNGIYEGLDTIQDHSPTAIPPTALTPKIRYDVMMQSFGGQGHSVSTTDQLQDILSKLPRNKQTNEIQLEDPVLINVFIKPSSVLPKILNAAH